MSIRESALKIENFWGKLNYMGNRCVFFMENMEESPDIPILFLTKLAKGNG